MVIFGLTISSSWGNGHATLWRGLCKHLIRLGHHVTFYEHDVPYYAATRDLFELPGGRFELFSTWDDIRSRARHDLRDADAAIVTSYCPDARAAADVILDGVRAIRVFYDLDTPITLARLRNQEVVPYIPSAGLGDFDLVLSFTGGPVVAEEFGRFVGARQVRPLYGHVDPDVHRPAAPRQHYRADLSYLGTYSPDRQHRLQSLFVDPAQARQDLRFLIGGTLYPLDFPWSPNIFFVRHLPPSEHAAFFASSRLTLNVTRGEMAKMGWCPSGRLFEAAACGAPLLSDSWEGLDSFFTPGEEIMLAQEAADTLAAMDMSHDALRGMAKRARERTLEQHSSARRASELIELLAQARHANSRLAEEA